MLHFMNILECVTVVVSLQLVRRKVAWIKLTRNHVSALDLAPALLFGHVGENHLLWGGFLKTVIKLRKRS